MADDSTGTSEFDARFRARFERERDSLAALGQTRIGTTEKKAIATLEAIAKKGLAEVLRRRAATQDELTALAEAFLLEGAIAVLNVGSQRGGDFLTNQLRGRWAEDVAMSMSLPDVTLLRFGPSGAAMPGDEDHRRVIATFKQIQFLEGKRPDLIAFRTDVWNRLAAPERGLAESWPDRVQTKADGAIVRTGLCGIEVKNSTWHYGTRRKAGNGPLSITVKHEELEMLAGWSKATGLPVLFLQVLFDEIYCMSFARMEEAIARGHVYLAGDYDCDNGAGKKSYHRFRIDGAPHLVGRVTFPSESVAHVKVLANGAVVPYIDLRPAQATDVLAATFESELRYLKR